MSRICEFRTEIAVLYQEFANSERNFPFSAKNLRILYKIFCFLLRIPKFLTQYSVFCLETKNSLQKLLLAVQKLEFPSRNYRFLIRNSNFHTEIVVGCKKNQTYPSPPEEGVQKLGAHPNPPKGREQKLGASPDPSEGGEQKSAQISLHAVRAPLLWRGWGRLSVSPPSFGGAGGGSPSLMKKVRGNSPIYSICSISASADCRTSMRAMISFFVSNRNQRVAADADA